MAKYNSGAWMSAAEINEERMGLMAAPPSGWREMAYIRRHPVYGYEPTAFYTHLDRPVGSSAAGAGPSGAQKQASKHNQVNPMHQPHQPVNHQPGQHYKNVARKSLLFIQFTAQVQDPYVALSR